MSLIIEGLKRAQQIRTASLGNGPPSASPPHLPENVSFRKKRWLFGAASLFGLAILASFFGGFFSPPNTGGSRTSIPSLQKPDPLLLPPEESRQTSIRPPVEIQPSTAMRQQRSGETARRIADLREKSPVPTQPSGSTSAREVPETGKKEDQTLKPSAEFDNKDGIFASGSRSEDRGELHGYPRDLPQDLPQNLPADKLSGRPDNKPTTRDVAETRSTDHPEGLQAQTQAAAPVPLSKAEPLRNEPSPPPSAKPLQESPPPAEEKVRSRPIEVRHEKSERSREVSSTSEASRQFNHAFALHQRKETAGAIEAYRKAIELNPASVEAYNNLGLIFQELGESDRAEWAYQKAIEIAPGYVKAYNNLGVLFLVRGCEDEAMDLFQKALAVDPGHYESHLHLGVLYRRRGQTHKAVESYQRALSIQPLQAEAYYNLGVLHEELENVGNAIRYYQKFTQMASDTYPDLVSKVRKHMNRLLKKQPGKKSE